MEMRKMPAWIVGIGSILALCIPAALAKDGSGDSERGRAVYNGTCIACHGEGAIPGAPDFTKKDTGTNTESDTVLLHHILNGLRDSHSPMAMPPKGGDGSLTVRDLRNVLAYLHKAFHYRKR